MRKFVDERVIPEAHSAELSGERPSKELVKEMSDNKILHMRLGPGAHLVRIIAVLLMRVYTHDWVFVEWIDPSWWHERRSLRLPRRTRESFLVLSSPLQYSRRCFRS